MKEFKIYAGEHTNNSIAFKNFLSQIEKDINADSEIIESAKEINREFTENAAKILADPENAEFAAGMIEKNQKRNPALFIQKEHRVQWQEI